jgi:hypothetical protein
LAGAREAARTEHRLEILQVAWLAGTIVISLAAPPAMRPRYCTCAA